MADKPKKPTLEEKIIALQPKEYTHESTGNRVKISDDTRKEYAELVYKIHQKSHEVSNRYALAKDTPDPTKIQDLDSLLEWVRGYSKSVGHYSKLHDEADNSIVYNRLIEIIGQLPDQRGQGTDGRRIIQDILQGKDYTKLEQIKQAFQQDETSKATSGQIRYHLQKYADSYEKQLEYAGLIAHKTYVATDGAVSQDHNVIRENLAGHFYQSIMQSVQAYNNADNSSKTIKFPAPEYKETKKTA